MAMEEDAREHSDPHHIAVQWLEEHVQFLEDLPKPSDMEFTYKEIVAWLEEEEDDNEWVIVLYEDRGGSGGLECFNLLSQL